jgi:hypothetical protein
LFDWRPRKMIEALKPSERSKGDCFGPAAILEDLSERIPRYLDDVDQGKLIYPACRRALSDATAMFVPSGTAPGWKRCGM